MRRPAFFDYIMNSAGVQGLKMPRGDKEATLNFEVCVPEPPQQKEMLAEIKKIDARIDRAREEIDSCPEKKREVLKKFLSAE